MPVAHVEWGAQVPRRFEKATSQTTWVRGGEQIVVCTCRPQVGMHGVDVCFWASVQRAAVYGA